MLLQDLFIDKFKEQRILSNELKALTQNDGEKIRPHIRRVYKREDDVEFNRRIKQTHFDNETLYTPVHSHIYKTKHKIISVELNEKEEEFARVITKNYYKGNSLVDYLYDELLEVLLRCSSAVLAVRYDKEEKAFKNNVYNENHIKYIELDRNENIVALRIETEEHNFIYRNGNIYGVTRVIDPAGSTIYHKVDAESEITILEDGKAYDLDGTKFLVTVMQVENNPFIFLGYKEKEDVLGNKYYTSFISSMLPHLKRYAEQTSEHALTLLRHAFPKTAAIAPPCGTCNGTGVIGSNAKTCGTCNGDKTLPISKSGADVVTFNVEALRNEITGSFMTLDQVFKEYRTPLETIKWQAENLAQIKKDSFASVFYNFKSEEKLNNQNESWRTVLLKKKAENEALIPFANYIIELSKRIIEVSAKAIGKPSLTGQIKFFPQLVDLTISEITEIIADLRDIEADKKVIEFFETKLIKQTYGEESREALLREIKTELLPFTNLDIKDISVIIGNNLARKIDLFLYFNYDKVINELPDNTIFVRDNKARIKEAILAKAQEMLVEVEQENTTQPIQSVTFDNSLED